MRAAIYTRISADQTGQCLGVTRQLEDCTALAERHGWDVVARYDDNDISAYSGKRRPGFEAMLIAMEAGDFDALLCYHTDRLYRSMKDLERVIDIADAGKIAIRTVMSGDLDLSTSAGRMNARILGSVARQESEHASERRRRAYVQKATAGTWQTANRPFGYTMAGVPLEPEATALRTAVTDVLAGKSISAVAREWNATGIPTTLGKTNWNSPRVRRLLVNPRYASIKTHHGAEITTGNWEPLIDVGIHRGLVAMLSDPARVICTSFERKYQGSGVYRCGYVHDDGTTCGSPMRAAQPSDGKRSYVCRKTAHILRQGAPLDEYVDMVVIERLSRPGVRLSMEDGNDIDVVAVEAERTALQESLDGMGVLLLRKVMTEAAVERAAVEAKKMMAVLDVQLAAAARVSPVAKIVKDGPANVARNWGRATPDERGKVIDELMTVSVLKSPRGTRGFHKEYIGIEWK
jgi:site-specific DNA recombinase